MVPSFVSTTCSVSAANTSKDDTMNSDIDIASSSFVSTSSNVSLVSDMTESWSAFDLSIESGESSIFNSTCIPADVDYESDASSSPVAELLRSKILRKIHMLLKYSR